MTEYSEWLLEHPKSAIWLKGCGLVCSDRLKVWLWNAWVKNPVHKQRKKRKKGLAGLDTAIILIAFIITASVLAYVAVSMGIFVTQKAKTTINKGEETASTALSITGNILYASNYPTDT